MDKLFILLISFGVTSLSLLLRALFLGDLEPGSRPVDFLLFGVFLMNVDADELKSSFPSALYPSVTMAFSNRDLRQVLIYHCLLID